MGKKRRKSAEANRICVQKRLRQVFFILQSAPLFMFEKESRVRKHTAKVDKEPNSHKNLMLANGFQISVGKYTPMLNIS